MSTETRLEGLRSELAHLVRNPVQGSQDRVVRVRRQIAMLTEDQRTPVKAQKGEQE